LPYLKNRPLVLNRHPNGIKGKSFYQKDTSREHLPDFVNTVTIKAESTGERVRYVVCNNKETLVWAANFGVIEMNPWQSRRKSLGKPDYLTIDLDPHGRSFDDVVIVALGIKKILDKAKVKSFVKTSGKSGLHIMIPLGAKYTYHQVREFAKLLVQVINKTMPELTTLEQRLNKRKGKIYLDIARNNEGQTTASVYSLRPTPGATVSTPLEWKEVKKGLSPAKFTIKTIFLRLKKKGDLFKGVLGKGADLTKAIKSLQVEAQKHSV
ncbi:MAG TPA: DNA ligase, partial [Candidatus Paceibacterota bacterium]